MIIKTLSRKGASGNLIKYVLRDTRQQEPSLETANATAAKGNMEKPFTYKHNIRARSIDGYIRAFSQNEALRIIKRKDSPCIYHSVLSFAAKDREHISEKVLKEMSRKYIELRGKDNLYLIVSHHDKAHIHLHCCMSATQTNGRSSRISRERFAEIKREMDAYQRQKYPELMHSLPRHGRRREEWEKEVQKGNIKRTERLGRWKNGSMRSDTTGRHAMSKEIPHLKVYPCPTEREQRELKELEAISSLRHGRTTRNMDMVASVSTIAPHKELSELSGLRETDHGSIREKENATASQETGGKDHAAGSESECDDSNEGDT